MSAAGFWRREGFDLWAGDNGAWADFMAGRPFDEGRFERFLAWVLEQPVRPQFVVLPDIVMGGHESLELSVRWLRKLRASPEWRDQRFLIAVQNGMTPADIRPLLGPLVGIFVGGDTEWKLATMRTWVDLARGTGAMVHVGRVNSAKRARLCDIAGVDSFDGSGPSRFEDSLRRIDAAFNQRDLEGYSRRAP